MHSNTQVVELQVYLRNNEKKILRKFRSITNPFSWFYGSYSNLSVISQTKVEKAKSFFNSWKNTTLRESDFPDVFILQTTRKELRQHKLPRFVERLESDRNFEKAALVWRNLREKDAVVTLPKMPSMTHHLKNRYNLECMLKGISGITILCSVDNVLGDLPALTAFSNGSAPKFSEAFYRRGNADYQHSLVNIYLSDPGAQEEFRSMSFQNKGRASPDIFVKTPSTFIDFVRELNRLRMTENLPPLGFLNYFLYQNSYAFRKKMVESDPFPSSYAIWDANSGLGKPNLDVLKREVLKLRHPKFSMWEGVKYHFGLRSNLMS